MILQELEHEHRILDRQIENYEKMQIIDGPLSLVKYEMKIKELKKKKLILKDKIHYYKNIS